MLREIENRNHPELRKKSRGLSIRCFLSPVLNRSCRDRRYLSGASINKVTSSSGLQFEKIIRSRTVE
jgi:hypothetical protein